MNEMEAHYSGQAPSGGSGGTAGRSGTGGGSHGTDSVRERVTDAARGAVDAARDAAGSARDTYDRATSMARDNWRSASQTLSSAQRRSAAQINEGWDTVETFVAENPVMIGVVGLAAGLLVGALLPLTRRENQVFGRYADEFRDQGMRYAREIAEQGRSIVEDNLHNVAQALGEGASGAGRGAGRDDGASFGRPGGEPEVGNRGTRPANA